MRLYYMTTQQWAPVILRNGRLKISTIPELNDPFELLGASIGERDMRNAMKILHEHWSRTLGMVCMTDNWSSPVMWAHYAEKHYGVCLGFEVADKPDLISKVDYVPDRLRDLLDRNRPLLGLDEDVIKRILATKYSDWSYEREYRLFAELKDQENGLYYLDFSADLVLREVILGARCKLEPKVIAREIRTPAARIEIIKARPAFDSFRVVRQLQVPVTVIEPVPT